MTIAPGTRLGPYEIVAPIGAGGMGEVYKARDTRLDRAVAVKILPDEFAQNAQLKLRFEREAKAISNLAHPHICTLHDIGRQDGVDYLIMEYLEGVTLAERIGKGPLPLADVIRYGIEITAALERAHEAGIVHRDLKPGNVMLTKTGAKLLDFGLAKSGSAAINVDGATVQKSLTQEGTILGTFQYMAPEQLEGQEADARTDIFALGTILYEMATGRRAFEGKTRTSLIAAIVDRDPPPIRSYLPLTPRDFERVVMTCLAKDPAARWQSAHDVRLELEWIDDAEEAEVAPRKRSRLAWSVAAALALLAIAASALYVRSVIAARNQPAIRTSILPPEKGTLEFFIEGAPPAISPDGKKIVFGASVGGGLRTLWLRSIDSPQPKQLSGTEGGGHPFWSPDGRNIAFYADGYLKKISAAGGTPVTICPSDPVRGGSWSPDGTIILGEPGGPIMRVSAAGGTPTEATTLDGPERDISHRWPWFLPDGKHFLFLAWHPVGGDLDMVCVGSTADKKMRKPLVRVTSNAAYYDGWLLFVRDQILTAQRFDPKKLELSGDPEAVPEQRVEFDNVTARGVFSVAADGTLVYETGEGMAQTQLGWLDRAGKSAGAIGEPGGYSVLSASPDGKSVAFGALPLANIWMYDGRGIKTRVTFTTSRDTSPMWSPDGTRIAFGSRRSRFVDLYVKDLRTGSEQPLIINDEDKTPTDWSADGKYLFFAANGPTGGRRADIHYYSFEDGKEHVYLGTPSSEGGAVMSRDGKWVAYWSAETGPRQVFVAPFPPTGAKWQVSSRGGSFPKWRRDGQELYFYSSGKLWAVPVKLGATPEFGQVAPLFEVRFGAAQSYDVSADGQKFLVNGRAGDAQPPAPLTLVQHFDSVLREVR